MTEQIEACRRLLEPDFKEQCPNPATGGLLLTLYASKTVQKRWGRRPMLRMIMDLPVCSECAAKMAPTETFSDQQWTMFSKLAQQNNNGVLPFREESEIEHIPFDYPEYVALRGHMAQQRAKEQSQPGQAAPQPEGAGNV